ncbi:MAG: hypothetical protein ACO3EZ_14990, partial [Prochlorotrichaceae cyanobacterium]
MRHTLLNPLLKPSKVGLLTVIPSLYFVIVLIIRTLRGPYWLGLNSDPDYIYLFSSINMALLDLICLTKAVIYDVF